jgi:lipoprotein-anchoring transpeptidase ErfK/SrfK
MPSRHMRAPENERGTSAWFDLPGVPWNTFFTYEGVAIHGTYWHNDFGARRSHGCVNVPIEVAKFVYLWTEPVTPYAAEYTQGDLPDIKSTEITVI